MDKAIVKAAACIAIAAMVIAMAILDKSGIATLVAIVAVITIAYIATKD